MRQVSRFGINLRSIRDQLVADELTPPTTSTGKRERKLMYSFTAFSVRLAACIAVIAAIASGAIAEDDLPQLIRQARTASSQ